MKTQDNKREFSPIVAACFTLNYVIGAGILTLPWAFHQAGILLTAFFMVLVGILAILSSDFLLSVIARADIVTTFLYQENRVTMQEDVVASSSVSSSKPKEALATEERFPLLKKIASKFYGSNTEEAEEIVVKKKEMIVKSSYQTQISSDLEKSRPLVKNRKFEITELSYLFLGKTGFRLYTISITLYLYGLLWAYTSVFASAMAGVLPIQYGSAGDEDAFFDSYRIYVLVFACIVVPLSLLDLSEQIVVQVTLAICRLILIFFIVVTPIAAAIFVSPDEIENSAQFFEGQNTPQGSPMFRFSGLSQMLPIVVFSTIFHHGLPGLAHEVKDNDKNKLGNIFGITLLICVIAYTVIGAIDSWYFGEGVNSSVNLNWANYHGFQSGWIASFISAFTVSFPAFDVVSAFPLNAIVLASSLLEAMSGYEITDEVKSPNKYAKFAFRLSSSVLPIIGGFFVRNLSTITDYTGLAGLAIGFCFPALLYIASERKVIQLGLPPVTHYGRFGSSIKGAISIFVFGVLAIMFNFLKLVL